MRSVALLLKMVRWRVALTLVVFVLLGAAWHGFTLHYQLLLAVLGVAASYACATSVNDLVDYEADRINLPHDPDRPLQSGAAGRRDLVITCVLAAVLALVCGGFISPLAIGLFVAAIVINLLYSLPPVQISHRPLLTPLYLPFGYAVVPFAVGVAAVGSALRPGDVLVLAALYLLFVGRIVLKDFRDRKGDAAVGKRTFLLTYGKPVTVNVSIGAVASGYLLLVWVMMGRVGWPALCLPVFGAANLVMLQRLRYARAGASEQLAIGVGAKMGNGLLVTTLGLLVLNDQSAPSVTLFSLAACFAVIYALNLWSVLRHPDGAVIAYKA